jgi:Na+-transporting methylmalonyl-CoA/oxaloacetate decarboxylase gamma subunit
MNGLQEAFYIVGIVFMSIVLLLLVALLISVFVIKGKINRIHDNIENKINSVAHIAERGGELAAIATGTVARGAKKALRKNKKK